MEQSGLFTFDVGHTHINVLVLPPTSGTPQADLTVLLPSFQKMAFVHLSSTVFAVAVF